MPENTPLISLIICTYKREELLINCIKSALNQDYKNLEIIVIDQTPNHTTKVSEFLQSINSKITYHFQTEPSITKARNVGLKISSGEIIVFVDDDTVFEKNFIQNHLKAQQLAPVIQGRIIEPGKKPRKKPRWLTWYFKLKGSDNCPNMGKTNILTGANFSIHRNIVKKVGYFDENFDKIAVGEDSDYGYRCFKKGIKMLLYPEAKVTHFRSDTGGVDSVLEPEQKKFPDQKKKIDTRFFSFYYYSNEMRLCCKHFSKPVQLILKIRFYIRGFKALRKLISVSEEHSRKTSTIN